MFLRIDFLALLLKSHSLEIDLPLDILDHVFLRVLVLVFNQGVFALSSFGIHGLCSVAWEPFPRVFGLLHDC